MGAAAVGPGAPVGLSTTLNPDGSVSDNGAANPTSGFSIIPVNRLDKVHPVAKSCPILAGGGSTEIADSIGM
jgi:hypothetical protein